MIFMCSLHDVHNMNIYRAYEACLHGLSQELPDTFWLNVCGCYAVRGHPKLIQRHRVFMLTMLVGLLELTPAFKSFTVDNSMGDTQTCEVGVILVRLNVGY